MFSSSVIVKIFLDGTLRDQWKEKNDEKVLIVSLISHFSSIKSGHYLFNKKMVMVLC